MLAPRLRHRITIQNQLQTQSPTTGAVELIWVTAYADEPAEVVPLSGREFIQGQTTQVEVSARMTIRWRPEIDPAFRIIFDGFVYQILAVLPDASARRWLTLMVRSLEPYGEIGVEELDGGDAATEPDTEFDGGGA